MNCNAYGDGINAGAPPGSRFRPGGWVVGITLALMALVLAIPSGEAWAAKPPIVAKAKLMRKTGKVTISGKVKSLPPGTRVMVYDAATQNVLYSKPTDARKRFSLDLQDGVVPCQVRLEVDGAEVVLPVLGNEDRACKKAPACVIAEPAGNPIIGEGQSLNFQAGKMKVRKSTAIDYTWTVNDRLETMEEVKADGFSHEFPHAGQYRVTLKTDDGAGHVCTDQVTVSVRPPAGANPNAKVGEQPAPGLAEALNTPDNAYVVLPFEETGMLGGSMIHLPYNPLIPYNALNAQVIQKVAHKPPLVDVNAVDVYYSAASNPGDPVGGDSINSTSQNLFASGAIGSNFDFDQTNANYLLPQVPNPADPSKLIDNPAHNDVAILEGQDYAQARIRKNEMWDRMRQPNAKALGIAAETGKSFADTQSTFTYPKDADGNVQYQPLTRPDQSYRGYVDAGAGTRQMPGIANPYRANDPQKMDYSSDQMAFVAQFIPMSDIDDQGRVNPYPLLRVEARDKAGAVVAKADAVYTAASETRCRECHLPGGLGSDDEVWRTPVTESEMTDPNDPGKPGPATGAGSFVAGAYPMQSWPPAIHNRFDDLHPDNPTFTNLAPGAGNPNAVVPNGAATLPSLIGPNGLRTDRVKASRWINLKTRQVTEVNASRPTENPGDWRLQIQIRFKSAQDYGGDSWVEQEKAALFNTLVMHDYMVLYGPTPAQGKSWPASYSTQVADNYGDDVGKSRAQPMYFCAGHHFSALKYDNGVASRSYPTNRSDYSRAFHAFHGKMQVYQADVSAGADGLPHKKGDLIRDDRGHPRMFGGRGWDSQHDDDNGVPLKQDASGAFTVRTPQGYCVNPNAIPADKPRTQEQNDCAKNNWAPDLFPLEANGELMLPFEKNGHAGAGMDENCLKCHTGPTERSYRDIHHASGIQCEDCHSDMLAVGNVYPNPLYDANLSGAGAYGGDSIHFRRPWIDQPDCGSCHVGDGNLGKDGLNGYFSAGAKQKAFDLNDPAGASLFPDNARFAVMPHKEMRPEKATVNGVTAYVNQPISQALYRKSADVHGSGVNGNLTCSTCHGGSHSIWPNPDPDANDNVTARQLQGYDGNIAECSVCHVKDDFKDGLVATDGGASGLGVAQGVREGTVVSPKSTANGKAFLAGPHGMHPVGDPYWYKEAPGTSPNQSGSTRGGWHNDMARMPGPDGEDQCAACHGADHKGTRLSKTLVKRTLTDQKGKDFEVEANTIIGCDLCHSLKESFTNVPQGQAQNHPPPKPESVTGGGAHAGGSGGHG